MGAAGRETFVGRAEALAALADGWRAVGDGATRIAWVVGEAGMGKTALVRRFIDEGGHHARWVSADEAEQQLRFGIAEQLLGTRVPSAATELEVGRDLLLALGGNDQPTVVVVDDLQWADPPSLGAVRFALRRVEADGVLVVVITRPDPWVAIGDPWRRFLEDGSRVRRIDVTGLTAGEVAVLAAGALDPTAAARLRAHTGGHPFHTAVLLDELGPDRIRAAGTGGILPAPRSFAALLLGRVVALTAPTRTFLSAGAVLGATFATADAARLAGVGDASGALEEALAADLLVRAGPGQAGFTHLLVQGAIYNDLAPTAARDLHRAAAEVTSGFAALRHRVEATDGSDDALAADLDVAAEAERLAGNHIVSSDLLLDGARVSGDPAERDRRTIAAVEVLVEAANQPRATAMRPLVEACPPSAHRELVVALLDLRTGRFEPALARFEAAISTYPDAPRDVRDRTFAGLGFVRWAIGDFDGAYLAVDEALRGDPGWGGPLTSYVRAMALMQLGRLGELDGTEAPAPMADVDGLTIEGIVRFYADDIAAATTMLQEVVDRSRRGESAQLFLVALGMLAEAEFRQGRWDDASIHAELAVSLATDTEAPMALVQAHTAAAEIQAARGRFVESRHHLEQAAAWVTIMPAWATRTRTAMARASLAIATDDSAALAAAAAELTAEPLRSQLAALPSWRWRAIVGESLLRVGDLDAASAMIAELGDVVARRNHLNAGPDLARLRGTLAEARGDLEGALACYAVDAEVADAAQSPFGVARLAFARGLLLRRRGEAAAATSLAAARTGFAALGAAPFLERCDVALGTAASDQEVLDLSPRQEAVALLVADGLTNKEIAAELYVSTKAVEYHLGQIYARTGIGSRRELGRRMRGEGR